jgi:hypothetical protein
LFKDEHARDGPHHGQLGFGRQRDRYVIDNIPSIIHAFSLSRPSSISYERQIGASMDSISA